MYLIIYIISFLCFTGLSYQISQVGKSLRKTGRVITSSRSSTSVYSVDYGLLLQEDYRDSYT